jgi:hypothetical protein
MYTMWTVTRQIYKGGLRIVEIVNGSIAEASDNMLPKNYVGEGGSFETFEQANEIAMNILRAWQRDTSEQPGYVPQLRVVELTNLLQTDASEEGGEKAHEEEESGGETIEEESGGEIIEEESGGETIEEESGGETIEEEKEVVVNKTEEEKKLPKANRKRKTKKGE